ncbi:MAG: AMP-binding protein [Betaproteobacteria bacterium]|nr:AMP-binding protein [Betaproteobacteria bacterium]
MSMQEDLSRFDTFPKLLAHHAEVRGARPAIREKDLGIWQTHAWSDVAREVRRIACGLAALGFKRGEHVAVIGDNRPRLYWAICAAQAIGGIPVPMYQDSVAAEMAYPIQNAEIAFAVVEDQEQVDKLLEILAQCPSLKRICFDDPRGMRHYAQQQLMDYEKLTALGDEYDKAHPGFYSAEVAKGGSEDTAAMFFTSGTTGHPKGVVLTHAALIDSALAAAKMEGLNETDEVLAYLPPAWIGQNIFSYAQPYVTGYCICCPESSETVMSDMREIGPTYYFAPPRVLEALLTQVSIRIEDLWWGGRKAYHYFMGVAQNVGGRLLDGKPVSVADRLLYTLGDICLYGPLRNVLGMSRVRVAYTAGEAIGPDLFRFYRSIGINLKQLYGSTETSVFVCVQPNGQVKADTVGPAVAGVELKFTPQRELLIRSPGLFKEYYKNPQATADAKDAEGWFHTGDAGFMDPDGHLKIIDRVKDVGTLIDGTLFAPKYLENKLKFFPYIKEAVAFGQGRDRACAFINIDIEAVGNWAERRNLSYSGYTDLASQDTVYDLVRECVEKVNADLAFEPEIANSQIHRFLILHKELDADDGELTRTRKVRRGYIGERYAPLVDALYDGRTSIHVEAQVKYEDGRTGSISADVKVRDAKTFKPDAAKKAA